MAKVLVVDDSMTMAKRLTDMIVGMGHEVVDVASDGIAALKLYEKHHPDVVTMDMTMPKMDGIGAISSLCQNHADAKIIMVTAIDNKQLVFRALEEGASAYILKPVDPDQLKDVIQGLL